MKRWVEEMRVKLCLSHVAAEFLDNFLYLESPLHVRWLVGVNLKPSPHSIVQKGLTNQWTQASSGDDHTVHQRQSQVYPKYEHDGLHAM